MQDLARYYISQVVFTCSLARNLAVEPTEQSNSSDYKY